MPLDLDTARALLERRDRAFMERDVEAYLALWCDDARIEGPDHAIEGKTDLRRSLDQAWKTWDPIHMSSPTFGVSGWLLHHEFVAVWERRGQEMRRLITGVGVAEIDREGRFVWLREYFDPTGTLRASALARPEIAELVPEAGFDTGV